MINLMLGDCLERLKELADNSVDSVVCDPPYGLSAAKNSGKTSKGGFMGKKWDYDVPSQAIWEECLRVLKPGGYLLAFAGTRTQHRMACRIEDAGFEIRDMIAWVYGSGFPKSLNISKALDKLAGAEREVLGERDRRSSYDGANRTSEGDTGESQASGRPSSVAITAAATEEAKRWDGWGTALKPSIEPITVARKPLSEKTVAANVLKHGTGGINIDGCRVETEWPKAGGSGNASTFVAIGQPDYVFDMSLGRWPANFIHDGSDEVLAMFPVTKSGDTKAIPYTNTDGKNVFGKQTGVKKEMKGDSGSAARFFYCAKASKKDRNEGLEDFELKNNMRVNGPRSNEAEKTQTVHQNKHPTVKPTDLMKYLCRLVTPPAGTVLDPFMGSGSTGKAAMTEGFKFIGCEKDESYFNIAKARIEHAYLEDLI